MEKMKRILFAFVCLFGVGMLNAQASVTINGTNLTDVKPTVTFTEGGSITWDKTNKVLTIDSAKVTLDSSTDFIYISNEDVEIVLKGESVVTNTGTGAIIHGNNNNLTITGTGSLKSQAVKYNIWVTGTLTIDGAKLDLTSSNNNYGALEADTLSIINNSNVKVVAKKTAIQTFNILTIKNSEVYAETNKTSYGYNAINVYKTRGTGDVLVEDSKVKALGSHTCIRALGDFSVKDSSFDLSQAYYGLGSQDDSLTTYGDIKIVNSNFVTTVSQTAFSGKSITIDNTLLNITNAYEIFNVMPTFSNMSDKYLFVSTSKKGKNATLVDLSKKEDLTTKRSAFIVLEKDTYSITASADDNSEVTVSNSVVLKNLTSTVTATITLKEGYKLSSVLVNDVEKISEITDGKLTLTITENTVIKVTSKAFEKEVDAPTIDTTKEVTEVAVGVKEDKTIEETLTKALEKSNIDVSGFDVKVVVAFENQKEEDVPVKAVESINALIKENSKIKVASFFDITLNVKNTATNETVGNLTELDSKLTFNVAFPKDLTNVAEGFTRTYYILRYHDGKSEILDAKVDGNILTFTSDKFSTYAIAYTDTENTPVVNPDSEANPSTGDNIILYVTTGIIAIAGLVVTTINLKKQKNN